MVLLLSTDNFPDSNRSHLFHREKNRLLPHKEMHDNHHSCHLLLGSRKEGTGAPAPGCYGKPNPLHAVLVIPTPWNK